MPKVNLIISLLILVLMNSCGSSRPSSPSPTLSPAIIPTTPTPTQPPVVSESATPPIQPAGTETFQTQTATLTNTQATEAISPTATSMPQITLLNMIDQHTGWAWSMTGQLLRTTDGGMTWTDRTPALNQASLMFGTFLDGQTAWMPAYLQDSNRIGMLHTSDGGQNWSEYPSAPASGMHFTDASQGWAVSGDVGAGNVYYSLSQTGDGGKTWSIIPAKPPMPEAGLPLGTIHLCNICDDAFYYDPQRMVIAYGDLGSMQSSGSVSLETSFDLGGTWKKQSLPLPTGQTDALVAPNQPSFSGEKGLLPVHLLKMNPDGSYQAQKLVFYSSPDGGKSWTLLPGELDNVPVYTPTSINSETLQDLYVAGEKSLYASHDGGRTWQVVPSNLDFTSTDTRAVSALDFVDAQTGWALVMENELTSLYQTKDGGIHWTFISPQLASGSPPVVTIDSSIPTPTSMP